MGMTPEQVRHLEDIKKDFCIEVDAKYRAGQAEHGGDIWDMDKIIDEAIKEAVDQYVYLKTLKQQIRDMRFHKL